jgi:hypothetical protein
MVTVAVGAGEAVALTLTAVDGVVIGAKVGVEVPFPVAEPAPQPLRANTKMEISGARLTKSPLFTEWGSLTEVAHPQVDNLCNIRAWRRLYYFIIWL